MTSYELIHFKKMARVWKTKSLLFCLRYDPLIVFWRQNHINFIFIKTMSHDLLVQIAFCSKSSRLRLSILKIASSNWKKKDNSSEEAKENCASSSFCDVFKMWTWQVKRVVSRSTRFLRSRLLIFYIRFCLRLNWIKITLQKLSPWR